MIGFASHFCRAATCGPPDFDSEGTAGASDPPYAPFCCGANNVRGKPLPYSYIQPRFFLLKRMPIFQKQAFFFHRSFHGLAIDAARQMQIIIISELKYERVVFESAPAFFAQTIPEK